MVKVKVWMLRTIAILIVIIVFIFTVVYKQPRSFPLVFFSIVVASYLFFRASQIQYLNGFLNYFAAIKTSRYYIRFVFAQLALLLFISIIVLTIYRPFFFKDSFLILIPFVGLGDFILWRYLSPVTFGFGLSFYDQAIELTIKKKIFIALSFVREIDFDEAELRIWDKEGYSTHVKSKLFSSENWKLVGEYSKEWAQAHQIPFTEY
jgi:hypothetical protein